MITRLLTLTFILLMTLGVASAEVCHTIHFNDLETGEKVKTNIQV